MISAVVKTELRWRSSRFWVAIQARAASSRPALLEQLADLGVARLAALVEPAHDVLHRLVRSLAAAKSSGASSFSAVAYQNSESLQASAARPRRERQPVRNPHRPAPGAAAVQRRRPRRRLARHLGGVEDHHLAERFAASERCRPAGRS